MILAVSCDDFGFLLRILGFLFNLFQWVIPILLIALVTFDILRAMIGGDEKKTKEATSKAFKRLMYAAIIFFIPILVRIVFRAIDSVHIAGYGGNDNSATSWISCFNSYFN